MRPKLNLKDKGQMSKPNEYTDYFKSNLTCIFLSVRAKFKKSLCPRTLCIIKFNPHLNTIDIDQNFSLKFNLFLQDKAKLNDLYLLHRPLKLYTWRF